MNEHLISNNFVYNVNKSLVKRNIHLINIILVLVLIYSCLDFMNWYDAISKSADKTLTTRLFFSYRIRPAIAIILVTFSIVNILFVLKANKLIDKSMELKDADHFNRAYTLFTRIGILSIIIHCEAIVSFAPRIILKY